ncbi:MAG TPA: hypothetical protein VMD79_12450 [Solirubrobacteraceae bacterium]|nr:hypothetical protein [Solirubrobacteraceae bacterium]
MSVEQRLALGFQLGLAALLPPLFLLGVQAQVRHFFFEEGSDLDQLVLWQLDRRVVVSDSLLNQIDLERPLTATVLVLLPTNADEIGIDTAPSLGVVDDQATATGAAREGALEIVVVLALLLTGKVSGCQ